MFFSLSLHEWTTPLQSRWESLELASKFWRVKRITLFLSVLVFSLSSNNRIWSLFWYDLIMAVTKETMRQDFGNQRQSVAHSCGHLPERSADYCVMRLRANKVQQILESFVCLIINALPLVYSEAGGRYYFFPRGPSLWWSLSLFFLSHWSFKDYFLQFPNSGMDMMNNSKHGRRTINWGRAWQFSPVMGPVRPPP